MNTFHNLKKSLKRKSLQKDETPKKKIRINGFKKGEGEGSEVLEDSSVNESKGKDTVWSGIQDEFSGKSFRTLFTSSNGLDAVKKFITICNTNKDSDLAAEYMLAGGNILEILQLLDICDKRNTSDTTAIFSAVNILLIKILAKYPQYQNSAIEACRHLLNSHISIIHSILSTKSHSKQSKIVLKLLAVIVSLGGNLSRDLLAHLSLQQQIIDNLVRPSKHTDSESIRLCFIHFILAFLVEDNTSVIKMLLDKRNLLSSIFPDLIYDTKDTVSLVLTTVRKYVLENVGISKTIKMHVFSTSVVLNLVSLYNWKGPNISKNKNHSTNESEEFLADKEIVTDVIHGFLIILLTSHRYGIIFHDRMLGTSRDKHNQLVHTVLQNLEKPWEHEKPSDLVVKIMGACPDLIRSQYNSIEPLLAPRVSSKWICLVKFLKKIIESIDLNDCIKICSSELSANNLINGLLSLTVPSIIMKNAISSGLSHNSLLVRHEVLNLLLTSVNQLKAISVALKTFYGTIEHQNQIKNFALNVVPDLDIILHTWSRAFEVNTKDANSPENAEGIPSVDLIEHLDVILNVLHLYKDVCPELLNMSTKLHPSELLLNLNGLQQISYDEVDKEAKMNKLNHMKVKVIQFLFIFDVSIFAPQEVTFKEAFLFLISLIRQEASLENFDVIRSLLNATGLFEMCDDQMDIWINGLAIACTPEENKELTKWFMSVLNSCVKHTDKYINIMTQKEDTINEQFIDFDVKEAKDIINELFEKSNEIRNSGDGENSTVQSSLNKIDSFNSRQKKDEIINGCISKEHQSSNLDQQIDKYEIQTNQQTFNRRKRKMINAIRDKLLNKVTRSDFPDCNNHQRFSTSASFPINKQRNLDINKIDNKINNISNRPHEEAIKTYRMQICTSVSPLLCCAFQKANKKRSDVISTYLSYVTVHTLHHQVIPELLVRMTADLTNLPIYKYVQSWSNEGQPVILKNKHSSLKLLHKMSDILLTDAEFDKNQLSQLFGDTGDSSCHFKYGDEEILIKHSMSLYDIKALLRITTFYLAQLTQRQILSHYQNEKCKIMLASLLNIVQSATEENKAAFEESASFIFTHPILLHHFTPFCEEDSKDTIKGILTQTILEICKVVVQLQKKYDNAKVCNIFSPFKDKFLTQLRSLIKNASKARNDNYDTAIELFRIMSMTVRDIENLLHALLKLEKFAFVSTDKQCLTVFGHIVPILLDISCEETILHRDQRDVLDDQLVMKLCLQLAYLKSKKINVEKWEQALSRYFSIFPVNIARINRERLALLLTDISASTVQLIAVLIAQNTKLIPTVVKYFLRENNTNNCEVFQILGSNLEYKWNDHFLHLIYKCHRCKIADFLAESEKQVSWIQKDTKAVCFLIENAFKLSRCKKICNSIAQSGDKLDLVPVSFVQLLESLYKRYENFAEVKEEPLTDLIKILLYVMTSTLKKETKNVEKIRVLCDTLNNAVIRLRRIKRDFVLNSLSQSYSWPQYTRFSLKLGLSDAKSNEIQSFVLKTLSNLCDIAYEDNCNDEYPKTLFEMTTSHSEFINIMLGQSNVKGELVELLRILIRKNHSVMIVSHISLYLAAYNATLSHVDQRILQILRYYEINNVKIQEYWPYLWGSAAAARYSVQGKTDTALWRKPSTVEVLNLLDKDIVSDTITNYPLHRELNNDELHESSNVYDPAFYLPLLCCLLCDKNVVVCHKINHSGALALMFAACCSSSNDIRMVAYTTLSRYYFHLEGSRSKEKLLWMRLIDVLRNAIASLNSPLKDVRLSCLVSTFLARTSLVASQPLHPLYSPLHTFLMAKPALDLNAIPELLQLLHSSHVDHKTHRYWILQIIRDGFKDEIDVDMIKRCALFKMLMGFHTSILSDTKAKKLILEIIVSATKIPKASLLLVQEYSMLPWLYGSICLNTCEIEIDIIVDIVENLLNSFSNSYKNMARYKFLLFSILSQLQAHLPKNTTSELRTRYTNVLQRINMVIKYDCVDHTQESLKETLSDSLYKV